MVQVAQKFEQFPKVYRRQDGSRWGGQDLDEATGGVVTRSYVKQPAQGQDREPRLRQAPSDSQGMNFAPELWFEDVENLRDVSAVRPSWFVDGEDNLALLDEELLEALRDETARAVLREVIRLPERDRRIVLGIV